MPTGWFTLFSAVMRGTVDGWFSVVPVTSGFTVGVSEEMLESLPQTPRWMGQLTEWDEQ